LFNSWIKLHWTVTISSQFSDTAAQQIIINHASVSLISLTSSPIQTVRKFPRQKSKSHNQWCFFNCFSWRMCGPSFIKTSYIQLLFLFGFSCKVSDWGLVLQSFQGSLTSVTFKYCVRTTQ